MGLCSSLSVLTGVILTERGVWRAVMCVIAVIEKKER